MKKRIPITSCLVRVLRGPNREQDGDDWEVSTERWGLDLL